MAQFEELFEPPVYAEDLLGKIHQHKRMFMDVFKLIEQFPLSLKFQRGLVEPGTEGMHLMNVSYQGNERPGKQLRREEDTKDVT